MAANGKKCLFNTGISFINAANDSAINSTWGYNTAGVQYNQCLLYAQGFTSVQLSYVCLTWQDSLFDQCCSDTTAESVSGLCQIWQGKPDGYVQAFFTLQLVCGAGADFFTVYQECCDANIELSEPCEIVQNLAGPVISIAYSLLERECDIDVNDLESSCANNCRGVKLSNIVVGGSAIIATTALATLYPSAVALSPIVPLLLGIGTVGLGAGGLMILGGQCMGPLFCITTQGQCCLIDTISNPIQGFQCPDIC